MIQEDQGVISSSEGQKRRDQSAEETVVNPPSDIPAIMRQASGEDNENEAYLNEDEYDIETTTSLENVLPIAKIKNGWGIFSTWARAKAEEVGNSETVQSLTAQVAPAWEKTKVSCVVPLCYEGTNVCVNMLYTMYRRLQLLCGRQHVILPLRTLRY